MNNDATIAIITEILNARKVRKLLNTPLPRKVLFEDVKNVFDSEVQYIAGDKPGITADQIIAALKVLCSIAAVDCPYIEDK